MMQSFEDYKAAWNRHDVSALAKYYGQNGTLTNPAAGRVSGEALKGWLNVLFTGVPDFEVEVVSATPVNDHTLAEQAVIKGTWTQPFPAGPLAGAKPTGKSFSVPLAAFYEWKDGKIISGTHYFDQMAWLTQIGVIEQK
ncbi:MAG TPA: ester cyclase [bacterium]|nr:ester cyclase [bacterium]